jgi:hypothetical protein
MVPPEYHDYQIRTCPAPGCPPAGPMGCCCGGWNLAEKCEKLKRFLLYQSVYKTPCCQKQCDVYRPPLYEWFYRCADGHPPVPPCLPPIDHCPKYRHPFLRLLGWPTGQGCANCGPVPY